MLKNKRGLGFKKVSPAASYQDMKDLLMKELDKAFRPEFINRLDDVIVFHSLTREDLQVIIKIEMKHVADRLRTKAVDLILSPDAEEFLIAEGFNPDFGARPLKRAIERLVEDPLSEGLLRGEFGESKRLRAERDGERLKFVPVPDEKPEKVGAAKEGSEA